MKLYCDWITSKTKEQRRNAIVLEHFRFNHCHWFIVYRCHINPFRWFLPVPTNPPHAPAIELRSLCVDCYLIYDKQKVQTSTMQRVYLPFRSMTSAKNVTRVNETRQCRLCPCVVSKTAETDRGGHCWRVSAHSDSPVSAWGRLPFGLFRVGMKCRRRGGTGRVMFQCERFPAWHGMRHYRRLVDRL